MAIFFSTVLFFGLIVTVAAGIVLVVQKVRHRGTRAGRVCIAAVVVSVVCFVGFGVTHEPGEKPQDPPPASSTEASSPEPAQGDAQQPTETPPATPPTVTTPEPEEPAQSAAAPTEAPTTQEPTPPEETEPTGTPETPAASEEPPEEVDPIEQAKQDIEEATRALFAEWYKNTTVDSVTVNEHLGTEKEGDFVLLVYATWDVKNSVKMTNKVLAMYSEDFAARVGQDLENIQELSVFWTVPYYSEDDTSVKYSYERAGAGMYETGHMILVE